MNTKKFIIFIIIVVLFIGGIGFGVNQYNSNKSGKFDQFAQALKDKGSKFYGAFWCPHCQAQKAEFGSSKKYLPYVECSNPDSTPTQICLDKQIESFPTWTFSDGITLDSDKAPLVCDIKTATSVDTPGCENRSSQYMKTWLFSDYNFSIKSPTEPIKNGSTWKFPAGAEASGEIPMTFLAKQINFILPQ